MGWRPWAVAVLVAPALAGCLGGGGEAGGDAGAWVAEGGVAPALNGRLPAVGPDAPEAHGERRELGVVVPFDVSMRDGVVLRGHAYLPRGNGPFATILHFSPYYHPDGLHTGDLAVRDGTRMTISEYNGFQALLEAGFAVVAMSLRGTGASDGCFVFHNVVQDGADGADVIEAIAAQPWSDGNVGMQGLSYHGLSQFATVAHGPPDALKAVVPVSGLVDTWSFLTFHGARRHLLHGTHRHTGSGLNVGEDANAPFGAPQPHHACEATIDGEAELHRLTIQGDKTPWFDARDLRAPLRQRDVPMLVTNGITKLEGHASQIDHYGELLPEGSRLIIGQWDHEYPAGDAMAFTQYFAVPWFHHHLRGGPAMVATGYVDLQDDAGVWHRAESWPPRSEQVKVWLSEDALVADAASVVASERPFHSPEGPAPAFGGTAAGPHDCPGDMQVVYTSPPLRHEVMLAGNFVVNLTLTSTEPNGNLAAYLVPGPLVSCIDWMVETQADPSRGAHGFSDLRHRGHLTQGRDFPVGTPDVVSLRSVPFAINAHAGERLHLVLAGASPHLEMKATQPVITVHTGPGLAADITLPVVTGTLAFAPPAG